MAGYSGTPLAKKLGIKPGMRAFLRGAPADVVADLKPALADVRMAKVLVPELDFILGFARSKSELRKDFAIWKKHLSKSGGLWVAWPKKTSGKTSGLETDLTSDIVRDIGLKALLVDIKVCAIDEQWSGLKFVYRKSDR